MLPPSDALWLVVFTIGAALHFFLAAVVVQKRSGATVDRLVLAALISIGLWHGCRAGSFLHRSITEQETEHSMLLALGVALLLVALALVVHAAIAWAGLNNWLAVPVYAIAPAMWWLEQSGHHEIYQFWVVLTLVWTASLCVRASLGGIEVHEQRFFRLFSATLVLIPLAAGIRGTDSASVVIASLLPTAVFARYVYRYNLFGLIIGQRIVFALKLGLVFAVYLLAIRAVAMYVRDTYGFDERLVEVVLIIAATLIWLPLYGWMTRFFSKRTKLYADFSKRLIEEAARILDLRKRLQFIAEEVGRTFALRRVMLATVGEPPMRGEYGMETGDGCGEQFGTMKDLAERLRADVYHKDRSASPEMRRFLTGCGFNYLFPLRYEGGLSGVLLLDTSPRLYLDENEAILLGMSRQISHSIETCRLIEEKIGLERALARQEHLASLGKVAATIAHEIKNPLSSVRTLAQLMREDGEVREKYDRDLGYMIGETDRLNRSVLQLLDFSRPVPEQTRDVDLSELLETMGQMLERQYSGGQVRVSTRIRPGLWLRGSSPEIVKQVVLNLALNAVQAMGENGQIRLEAETAEGGKIVISVTDQGPGIPGEIREKIFEAFFTTKQRGTGLGLAIVRKNVRHLGGEIQVESPVVEGRGTRMVVTLPAG
jgi:signal transduction histidine kinase